MTNFIGTVYRQAIIEWTPTINQIKYDSFTKNIVDLITGNLNIFTTITYKVLGEGNVKMVYHEEECHGIHKWVETEFEDVEEIEPYFKIGDDEFEFEFYNTNKDFSNYIDILDSLGNFKIKEILVDDANEIEWEVDDDWKFCL